MGLGFIRRLTQMDTDFRREGNRGEFFDRISPARQPPLFPSSSSARPPTPAIPFLLLAGFLEKGRGNRALCLRATLLHDGVR
jgi:hypothetical protein